MDNIRLLKVGDPQPEYQLPRGIRAVRLGDRVIFVRSIMGRMMPLPQLEQEALAKKLGWIND
jgi:hypothetical protein